MIYMATETVLTLSQATRYLPRRRRGKKPSSSTLYRWATRGLKGVVLESIQIGGQRCTSLEAIQRFFDRLTEAAPSSPAPVIPSGRRTREELDRALDEAGL